MSTIQIGTVATSTAARPDGTCCSDHTTPPLPPRKSRPPVTTAHVQFVRVGVGAPRARAHAYSTAPATRKRTPAMRKGGSVSMAYAMAR
jgi:hypothetical protein